MLMPAEVLYLLVTSFLLLDRRDLLGPVNTMRISIDGGHFFAGQAH